MKKTAYKQKITIESPKIQKNISKHQNWSRKRYIYFGFNMIKPVAAIGVVDDDSDLHLVSNPFSDHTHSISFCDQFFFFSFLFNKI